MMKPAKQTIKSSQITSFCICICICCSFCLSANGAERWILDVPQRINYDSTRLNVLSSLLRQEIEFESGIEVQNFQKNLLEEMLGSASRHYAQPDARFGLSGTISQVDTAIFIYIDKWGTDGESRLRIQQIVPKGIEVSGVIKSLASSLITEKILPRAHTAQIAVLDLAVENISEQSASVGLTGKLCSELLSSGKFTLVERERMDAILKEQGFQTTGCSSNECVVQIGHILNVQNMVAGQFEAGFHL